jgi:hypothetical protein
MQRFDTETTLVEVDAGPRFDDVKPSSVSVDDDTEIRIERREHEIWVGYARHGRYFLDVLQSSETTNKRLQEVQAWWERRVPRTSRTVQQAVFCQRRTIMIGILPPVCQMMSQVK